jgi:hypothetical protein
MVTFLFTDVEGSTRWWEADADGMRVALVAHDEVLRNAIELARADVPAAVGPRGNLSELALAACGLVQLNRRLQRPCGDRTKR